MTASFGSFSVFKQDGIRQFYCRWSQKEDELLIEAVKKYGSHRWSLIAQTIPGRTPAQCSTRWHGALNSKVHKGRWSTEEDEVLLEAVRRYLNDDPHTSSTTTTNIMPWNHIAEHIPNRTGIQCQSRWTEALDPAVRKGRWNKEEDELLRQAVLQLGCCWIRVAGCIPSRTQRQCRTRWNQIKNTRQSKRRPSEQLQQHQPIRTSKPSLPPASSMTTLSLGNNTFANSKPPSSPSDSPPPSTPPTCIPAMIIPSSDYPQSISTAPPSSSYPTSLAAINIPKDPFSFLLDHDLPSSFLTGTTPSSLNHLDNWFYGSSH
ncbi:hypothetical protein [Absidia glauca]|uniref:Homeodomain-like protein n=1 Tax=Absidia glauca TaxID=4829 RepID=A0A168NZ17_ABSGL|nr:hypothetical protein [Absidia glauca]